MDLLGLTVPYSLQSHCSPSVMCLVTFDVMIIKYVRREQLEPEY